jgi:N-acyl-D-amino-acid deacylase
MKIIGTIKNFLIVLLLLPGTQPLNAAARYDLIIRNGVIYDGLGGAPYNADIAIKGDKIAAIGRFPSKEGRKNLDVHGLAVAPGFINMLSWAGKPMLIDGRSQSDIRQGVTLEIMGEGISMGPLSPAMREDISKHQGDIKFAVKWNTLAEFFEYLEHKGISANVASFVGATTVRIHEIGYENRAPTSSELDRMCRLVSQSMEEGALGVGASLIYAPAFYAKTDELIALAKTAARYNGMYIAHIRNEGNSLLEAADEHIRIARDARIRAEFYHMKAAGHNNWTKLEPLIQKIEAARAEGLELTADMYTYTAAATGLDASMPPWVQEGGNAEWIKRLKDPAIRERVRKEMTTPTNTWENFYLASGSPTNILLIGFENPKLKNLTGKTLAEIATARGKSPADTAMDLVIEDGSRIETVYFLMSEENVRREIALPWMAFDSDAESVTPEGVFLKSNPHPRAYGTFARLLGKYVRDEKVVPLQEAVRRLTSFPASNLRIDGRGQLKSGFFADIVVFDPATIQDHATYDKPHQYSTGVEQVFVNGVQVVKNGEHTGAKPGRFVRGPGWKPKPGK